MVTDALTIPLEIPAKLGPLLSPRRYKIAHSGRGAAKSWTFARVLLFLATRRPLRILCAREVQRSIKDSVHALLKTQITLLGLEDHYEVLDTEIRGRNGSHFLFSGLLQHTITSIKSFEGIDLCWVEEAQTVSARSWKILIPTIREPGSEIWISFNPELDTDETWVRFIEHPPEDSVIIPLTWRDNPWFPPELEAERRRCEQLEPDDYPNIWEGIPRSAVEGAIYAHEIAAMIRDGRLGLVPYDPRLKVHVVVDPGWNDFFAVGWWQRLRSELRCIKYREYQYTRTDQVAAEIRQDRLNWGSVWMPHDAYYGERKSGTSDAAIFRSFGFLVPGNEKNPGVPNIEVEAGIRLTRQLFSRMAWNKPECGRLVECAKRYRRAKTHQNVVGDPVHDENSNGMDMCRYAALVAEKMRNEPDQDAVGRVRPWQPADRGMGALGAWLVACLLPFIPFIVGVTL